jgi:hypothetical protein
MVLPKRRAGRAPLKFCIAPLPCSSEAKSVRTRFGSVRNKAIAAFISLQSADCWQSSTYSRRLAWTQLLIKHTIRVIVYRPPNLDARLDMSVDFLRSSAKASAPERSPGHGIWRIPHEGTSDNSERARKDSSIGNHARHCFTIIATVMGLRAALAEPSIEGCCRTGSNIRRHSISPGPTADADPVAATAVPSNQRPWGHRETRKVRISHVVRLYQGRLNGT